jgi:hypothetical protein
MVPKIIRDTENESGDLPTIPLEFTGADAWLQDKKSKPMATAGENWTIFISWVTREFIEVMN